MQSFLCLEINVLHNRKYKSKRFFVWLNENITNGYVLIPRLQRQDTECYIKLALLAIYFEFSNASYLRLRERLNLWFGSRRKWRERERGEPLKGKSRKTYQNLITLQKYCTLQLERDAGYVLKQESKNWRPSFSFENDPPYKLYNTHLPTESTILWSRMNNGYLAI